MKTDRNVNVITDLNGKKVVVINDIYFYGKQHIKWDDVEQYLKRYIDEFYEVAETKDIIYIGKDLPDEYTSSKYTRNLRGILAKIKANAVSGIPEMIEIAERKRYQENMDKKHKNEAKHGWYRYDTRFALPVYNNRKELVRHNYFQAELIIRHASDGKMYLYDVLNIKKKRQSNPLE